MPEIHDHRDDRSVFLDELLDASLARYAQTEPRPGLEARLLARLRSEPEPALFPWRWLPAAAAAVLALAVALYFASSRESRLPEVAVQPRPTTAPVVAPPQVPQRAAVAPVRRPGPKTAAPRALAGSAPPRREQFFQPSALSAQEAALMRFVSQAPPEELRLVARENRSEPIGDLRLERLEIPPVVIGENDSQ
jgi:hypothetical protein